LNPLARRKVQHPACDDSVMDAERSEGTAELRFGHPVETVFEMFTPEGERAWAAGWDPRPIHPPDETGARDAVFSTEHGGRDAVWTVTELDRANNVAGYVNFVAGNG
jgi:hypothetical protein